jgi:peptide/nickel transport system substrate-binding protein
MTIDESGTVYTVTLRPQVRWHDGTNLTANDVAFTVNLIKNPEARSPIRVNWTDVSVQVIDAKTVQFKLPVVYAAFPHALTFSVLPQHILGDVAPGTIRENTFSQAPVGSGPFDFNLLQTIDAANQEKLISMTAFPDYYRGESRIKNFELHAYADQEQIMRALRTGEVTAAADLTVNNAEQVDKHNYEVHSQPVDNGVYAMFNMSMPTLKDKAVRQALQLATDTGAIRRSFSVMPPALDTPFIGGQLTGDDVPRAPKPDAAKAAALLDQAGWKLEGVSRKKDGQLLQLSIVTTKNSQYEKALETLAGQWRQLGVTVNTNIINTADPGVNFVTDILQRRTYDVLLYELSIGSDPDVYAYWHSSQIGMSGFNFSNYSNSTSDAALSSARSRLEPDLRNAKYKAFAAQWLDDVPAIGLYQSVAPYVVSKSAQTVSKNEHLVSAQDRYVNILYWNVQKQTVYKTP